MKNKAFDIALITIAAVLAVGVMTAFHACEPMEDGTWMNCHHAQLYVFYLGVGLIVLSFLDFFIKNKTARLVMRALAIVLSIIAVLIPNTIVSLCMMDVMRCHALMKPFVRIMGILFAVLEAATMFIEFRKKDSE